MTLRSIVMALGAGFAAGAAWMISNELCRRRRTLELKEEVSRWEGEGGNVPSVETVSPQVVAGAPRS